MARVVRIENLSEQRHTDSVAKGLLESWSIVLPLTGRIAPGLIIELLTPVVNQHTASGEVDTVYKCQDFQQPHRYSRDDTKHSDPTHEMNNYLHDEELFTTIASQQKDTCPYALLWIVGSPHCLQWITRYFPSQTLELLCPWPPSLLYNKGLAPRSINIKTTDCRPSILGRRVLPRRGMYSCDCSSRDNHKELLTDNLAHNFDLVACLQVVPYSSQQPLWSRDKASRGCWK